MPLCSRSSASCGRAARLEHRDRVLVVGDRQQRREVADVLLEQVEDRGDPALAEPHPRPHPCALSSSLRVSAGLLEQRDRVSRHSSLPSGYGELAPTASWIAEIACEAFQYAANWSGEVCTWNCVLVHAASGRIESAVVTSRSGPVMSIAMSSPRAPGSAR